MYYPLLIRTDQGNGLLIDWFQDKVYIFIFLIIFDVYSKYLKHWKVLRHNDSVTEAGEFGKA